MLTYISAIFRITDRFRRRILLAPEVSIFLNDRRIQPLYKTGGYFIFTDLPSGRAAFEISSPIFRTEKVALDIPEAGSGYVINHLMMNPSRNYPFGGPVTTVSGRLTTDGVPVSEGLFHLIPGDGGEVMKIAEDKAVAGNSRLKLFATVPGRQLSIPGKYMIKDKEEVKREFCLITQNAEKEGIYPLQKGLAYSHPRATPLVEVIECATLSDGSFFTALPDLKERKAALDILVQEVTGHSVKKAFEIEAYKENNLGDIEI